MQRRIMGALVIVVATTVMPSVPGTHDAGCVPGAADPSTYTIIDLSLVGGGLFYLEERGNPVGTSPPVPGSGYLLGDGTWMFQETNALDGLQRWSVDPDDCWFLFPPPPQCVPFLLHGGPLPLPGAMDEHCGHGPDNLIVDFWDGGE